MNIKQDYSSSLFPLDHFLVSRDEGPIIGKARKTTATDYHHHHRKPPQNKTKTLT